MIMIVLYKDMLKKLEAKLNSLLNSSSKEDNTKSINSSRQTMHSPSRVENENMGDTGLSNDVTEIHFNSLNDPPPTPVFDDGHCIYQTPTPSKINNFTPNSPPGNQHPYPFGYLPVLVPGIVHYSPCWLPSWGGWIASWISWISPPTWIWPSFVWMWSPSHSWLHDKVTNSVVDIFFAGEHIYPQLQLQHSVSRLIIFQVWKMTKSCIMYVPSHILCECFFFFLPGSCSSMFLVFTIEISMTSENIPDSLYTISSITYY